MQRYVNSTIDVILDRTADELIAGLLVALLLSLALAGAFALFRRKVNDATTLITCLALAMNLVGMTVAAGFVRGTRLGIRGNPASRVAMPMMPPGAGGDRMMTLARVIFEQADTNGDGMLSQKEAAVGAEKFVRQVENIEGGPVNEALLRASLRRQIGPPPEMFGPGPAFDTGRNGAEHRVPGPVTPSLESSIQPPRPLPD